MVETLPTFASSADLEVQERATSALQLMKTVQKLQSRGERLGAELQQLFSGELNPVAPKAQKKVGWTRSVTQQWHSPDPCTSRVKIHSSVGCSHYVPRFMTSNEN